MLFTHFADTVVIVFRWKGDCLSAMSTNIHTSVQLQWTFPENSSSSLLTLLRQLRAWVLEA